MDGRPHPSEMAPHTFQGFSTGTWEGNMLSVYTTHQKESYLRRNGLPRSDKGTFVEHWMRHGDILTVVTSIRDPVFLTEPLVRSQNWRLDPGQRQTRTYCEVVVEVPAPPGAVPAHLPGTNPFLHEVADWYGLPWEATRGGSETLYPEYQGKAPKPEHVPAACDRYCHCGANGGPCDLR